MAVPNSKKEETLRTTALKRKLKQANKRNKIFCKKKQKQRFSILVLQAKTRLFFYQNKSH